MWSHDFFVFRDVYSQRVYLQEKSLLTRPPPPIPGGIPPYIGYIVMCDPKGYGFSAVLVINRVWLFSTQALVWPTSIVFIIIEKEISKSLSQIMFMVI